MLLLFFFFHLISGLIPSQYRLQGASAPNRPERINRMYVLPMFHTVCLFAIRGKTIINYLVGAPV
jgi:hypothetical protein